jgi:hypothetical protein
MTRVRTLAWALCAVIALLATQQARASIIFDDFNTNSGHFATNPTFSSTSNVSTASTSGRITSDAFEGAGSESINAVLSTTNPARIRFLSGTGTPSNHVSFTTSTATTDGWIGFYYKTDMTGAKLAINLDGPTGSTADMDMSALTTVTADNQWHLLEWNLDAASGWGAVTGIGGGHSGVVVDGAHTIDSIYVQNSPANGSMLFDFVAKSDSGSIAALVPEPGSALVLGAVGLLGLVRRKRRA